MKNDGTDTTVRLSPAAARTSTSVTFQLPDRRGTGTDDRAPSRATPTAPSPTTGPPPTQHPRREPSAMTRDRHPGRRCQGRWPSPTTASRSAARGAGVDISNAGRGSELGVFKRPYGTAARHVARQRHHRRLCRRQRRLLPPAPPPTDVPRHTSATRRPTGYLPSASRRSPAVTPSSGATRPRLLVTAPRRAAATTSRPERSTSRPSRPSTATPVHQGDDGPATLHGHRDRKVADQNGAPDRGCPGREQRPPVRRHGYTNARASSTTPPRRPSTSYDFYADTTARRGLRRCR